MFREVIASKGNGEKIFIARVPGNGSNMFLFLFITESPYRKELTFDTLSFFSFLPIILVVVVFSIFLILSDHSFHNFHASLERSRVSASS